MVMQVTLFTSARISHWSGEYMVVTCKSDEKEKEKEREKKEARRNQVQNK